MNAGKELRSLHHLNRDDIFPDNFQKMNVGAAIRFFSLKTAGEDTRGGHGSNAPPQISKKKKKG